MHVFLTFQAERNTPIIFLNVYIFCKQLFLVEIYWFTSLFYVIRRTQIFMEIVWKKVENIHFFPAFNSAQFHCLEINFLFYDNNKIYYQSLSVATYGNEKIAFSIYYVIYYNHGKHFLMQSNCLLLCFKYAQCLRKKQN